MPLGSRILYVPLSMTYPPAGRVSCELTNHFSPASPGPIIAFHAWIIAKYSNKVKDVKSFLLIKCQQAQGWVMKSGGICPSLILTGGSKWVNYGKIWLFSESLMVYVAKTCSLQMKNATKNVVQYDKAFGPMGR